MIEGKLATAGSGFSANQGLIPGFGGAAGPGGAAIAAKGTQGLFDAVQSRGNVMAGYGGTLTDFDAILQNLDSQGAIEENMLFLSRATALDFDDMIAAQAGGGFSSTAAASYGLFDNQSEMALNFGY